MKRAIVAVSITLGLMVFFVMLGWAAPVKGSPGSIRIPNDPPVLTPTPGVGELGPAFSASASVTPSLSPRSTPTKSSRHLTTPRVSPTHPVLVKSIWIEAIRDCIARRESGRNPLAVSPSGTYTGAYQFDRYSFHAASGLPGEAKDYSMAVQTQAFYVWFDGGKGRHRWSTYGYCQNLYGGPE